MHLMPLRPMLLAPASFPPPAWPLTAPAALLPVCTPLWGDVEEQLGARAEPRRGR